MVKDIIPASPASKNAQVRIGDIIIDVDGNDVSHLKVRVRVCKTLTHTRARTHTHTHTHTQAAAVAELMEGEPNSPVTMMFTRVSPVYAAKSDEQIVVTLLRSGGATRARSMLGHKEAEVAAAPFSNVRAAAAVASVARSSSGPGGGAGGGGRAEPSAGILKSAPGGFATPSAGQASNVLIGEKTVFDQHGEYTSAASRMPPVGAGRAGPAAGSLAQTTADLASWGQGAPLEAYASMSFLWGAPVQDRTAAELYAWKQQVLYGWSDDTPVPEATVEERGPVRPAPQAWPVLGMGGGPSGLPAGASTFSGQASGDAGQGSFLPHRSLPCQLLRSHA